ncbi:hypothetical protein LTR10_018686 [Elasticomyces elasticus]|uniref:Enoyl reductase (ER) domain-containing protein n=1 Tax=Exophiala sideris TaxID=1016849 RepID=A0ABR0JS88_9EURO|nr:hypothetical protein LTR10_018686 [Elasticomyces elasticus]KAK5040433.1 hypothetical protein LTS07_000931 [Exophiala sideris]KAK5068811.1 hypothetical protein LTR69_000932 [Exophiala sideris]KAK5186408.1 hypothetical protein LTR44_001464 [Eurotiomycetes sp. CCFEE 6388]
MGSIAKTMKAGQWDPKQNKVIVNELPIPEPGSNEILVKITSASLCHSDIMSIERPGLEEPFTMGHEGVGIIDKLHPSVEGKGYSVGDAIGFLYIVGCCFECEGCMVHNLQCLNGKPEIQGFTKPGFFAEYAVVDYRNAVQLPKQFSLKTSSVFFCAGITGQWLGVIGAGGLGQLATQYAKAMGANVVAIDINDSTLEVCKAQGADVVFNSKADPEYVSKIKELTKGGVQAAAVFSNAQVAYANAPNIIRVGGTLMVVGIAGKPIEVSTMALALGAYNVKSESTSIPQRMKKAVDFSAKHEIAPEVEIRTLDELDNMVKEMRAGTATKRMAVNF